MATKTDIDNSIASIIAYANGTTGKTDATLTDAVRSLIDGYGADTLLDETMQVATTSTSASTIKTIDVPQTYDTYIMLAIDTAGPRNGYYYGTISVVSKVFGTAVHLAYTVKYASNAVAGTSSSYGIYMSETMSGDILRLTLYKRYHATYAPAVNGVYRVRILGVNLM